MVNFKNVMFYSRKCDGKTLLYDEACLSVATDKNVTLLKQYTECEGCDYVKGLSVNNGSDDLLVRTLWPLKYKVESSEGGSQICNGTFSFKEYGRYELTVLDDGCSAITITEQPDEPMLPLLVAIVTMLAIATLWYLVKGVFKRISQSDFWNQLLRRGEPGDELLGANPSPTRRASTRLLSADVFRGITISLMILVNYGGGGYSQLRHAVWNGLTVADLVFPWFAWLMGLSLCLSLHTRLRTAMTRWTAFTQVVRRTVILICLGIVLGSKGRTIEELRIPGVLQRLGLAYFIVAGFECYAMNASINYTPGTAIFRDLRSTWRQWCFTFFLVTLHVAITLGVSAPECPRGYMGPGGLHKGSVAPNCTGGIAGHIDREVFGALHLYKGGTYRQMYQASVHFDPEGLLGTLTCALVVQLGAQAARVLLAYSHAKARVSRWLLWSSLTGLLAGCLCLFTKNDGPIPINKNLWSLSYCLAASSLAFFIQAMLYLLIDMQSIWGGRPFYYAGRNALLLYMGSELMKNRFPFEWKLENPSHMQLLAMNSLALILWLTIGVFLHRKNVILTI